MKFSTTAGVVGLGLAASLATTSATLVEFKQNLVAMTPQERDRIQFNEYEVHPVPHFLLGMSAPKESTHPSCEIVDKTSKNGKAEILIALSKCLSQTSIDNINAWIASISKDTLKHTNADGSITEMTFVTSLIDDVCQSGTKTDEPKVDDSTTPPTTDYGDAYKSQALLAESSAVARSKHQHSLSGELLRLQAFTHFGRVLEDAGDAAPIAVMSFTDTTTSYDKVKTLVSEKKITKAFNFQVCPGEGACTTTLKDSIKLTQPVDLFLYNPFKIIRAAECKKLDGGIPVTYTPKGSKQAKCFCMCPPGTEYTPGAYSEPATCKRTDPKVCDCVWKEPSQGSCIENTVPLEKCVFANLSSTWNLPVPFPVDNYVGDNRTNAKDGPQINLVITKTATEVYTYDSLNVYYETANPGKVLVVDTIQSSTKSELLPELAGKKPAGPDPASTVEVAGKPVVKTYDWKEYQQNRVEKIDSIEFKAYGKYTLKLVASDYDVTRNATCDGCVAVVDKFRPKSTVTCPVRVCDSTTTCTKETDAGGVEATAEQLEKVSKMAETVYKFPKDVVNDACSSSMRCDTKTFAIKDWFAPAYDESKPFDEGKTCLDKAKLQTSLKQIASSRSNPLAQAPATPAYPTSPESPATPAAPLVAKQDDVPVDAFSCKRCCKYGVDVKEWWVDYKCGYDYDISRCEGRNSPESLCNLEQCVVLDGKTLASASTCVKESVRTESQKVLDQLEVKGFQAVTQVHRALTCTAFDPSKPPKPECVYEAAVGDLIDATYKTEFFDGDADKYVFWRYKITGDAEGWKLWNPKKTSKADKYKFTGAATKIAIEAWTACGRVHHSYFFVHLHLQTEIKVCEFFPKMWYQTTVEHADITSNLCAYPGSDFAELTFEYQANIGLQYARDALRMEVSGVQCSLAIENRKGVEILNIQGKSMDVLERYAVELHTLKTTAQSTKFKVACSFTYARFDNSTKVEKCEQAFTIIDCEGPKIDVPPGSCNWDNCTDQSLPGPYEVCGGSVVSSTATTTTFETKTGDKCCQGCVDAPTTCTSILELPEESDDDIKRCVPETPPPGEDGAYGAYNSDTTDTAGTYGAVAFMAQAAARHPTAAAATVLLAASAMVAVVALVVVRQRRTTAQNAVIVEDAYYPLLH